MARWVIHLQATQLCNPPLGPLAEAVGNEGKQTRMETQKSVLLSVCRSRSYRAWLWYVLRREFCTFRSRIRYALLSVERPYSGTDPGPGFQETLDGNFLPCQRTLARIQDMQQLPQVWQKWVVTPLDYELFLLGWTAGARWAEQRDRKNTQSQSLGKCPSSGLDYSDKSVRPAILQSSKRGQ